MDCLDVWMWFGEEKGGGGLTLLICGGAVGFNQTVERGHELGVAADAGELGGEAARGFNALFRWGFLEIGCVRDRGAKKGGFTFRERVGLGLITHGTIGELGEDSTLDEGSGCSEGCGQEGESSDGVLHFMYIFSSLIYLSFGLEVSGMFVWF